MTIGLILTHFAIAFFSGDYDNDITEYMFTVTLFIAMSGYYFTLKAPNLQWRKLQLTMPIKRSEMIASQYLVIIIMLAVAVVVTGMVLGLMAIFYSGIRELTLLDITLAVVRGVGVVFFQFGLMISLTKVTANSTYQTFLALSGLTMPIILVVSSQALTSPQALNLSYSVAALIFAGLGVVSLVVSYPVTLRLFAKCDFFNN